ncbi:RidA family protein [Natrialba asiatica]|uniref:RidA family protein n=1 Tax=Natrialba asiatica TaxID=64602 RepID=UPI001F4CC25A|nr:Rid family hydrolase [Natrialba asiatica]
MYLADMDAYEDVNDTYEQFFAKTCPARTTVGICELLGGAAVTVEGYSYSTCSVTMTHLLR